MQTIISDLNRLTSSMMQIKTREEWDQVIPHLNTLQLTSLQTAYRIGTQATSPRTVNAIGTTAVRRRGRAPKKVVNIASRRAA